ncbi:MAG: alpha/beta hydrolase, partial [Leptospira sp.]|nr:alpha/beta hydrolase [Leptospira sp.]
MILIKKVVMILFIAMTGFSLLYLGIMKYEKINLENELKAKTDITSQDGIQSIEKWMINGNGQWVSIRGQNKNNPIILMVHGGPGSADMSMARHIDLTTEKYFVVIRWDQRNAGKSFSFLGGAGELVPETYLADLHLLVQEIKKKFSRNKIYIAGHSWGSIISAISASRNPEDYYAYIGIGQFVHGLENEKYSYRFTLQEAEKDKNEKAIRELKEIGEPPFEGLRKLGVERDWLGYYGGAMFHGEHRKDAYDHMGKMMF